LFTVGFGVSVRLSSRRSLSRTGINREERECPTDNMYIQCELMVEIMFQYNEKP